MIEVDTNSSRQLLRPGDYGLWKFDLESHAIALYIPSGTSPVGTEAP